MMKQNHEQGTRSGRFLLCGCCLLEDNEREGPAGKSCKVPSLCRRESLTTTFATLKKYYAAESHDVRLIGLADYAPLC